jgi:hypothetical protein
LRLRQPIPAAQVIQNAIRLRAGRESHRTGERQSEGENSEQGSADADSIVAHEQSMSESGSKSKRMQGHGLV